MNTTKLRVLSVLIAAILLLLPLAGCGKKAVTLDDLPETRELVIYLPENDGISGSGGNKRMYIDHWTMPYWRLYDNFVFVRIVEVPGTLEDYEERVMNEILGGGGPDIIFSRFLPNIDMEKSARNHSFFDLTGLMETDPDFHTEDYAEGLFDAVKIGGRQYTVPIAYDAPVYFSDRNRLDDLGFSWEGIETTADFIDELVRMEPAAAEDEDFIRMLGTEDSFAELLGFSGIRLLDYETEKVLPDEADFRAFLESYKAFYAFDRNALETFNPWNHDGFGIRAYEAARGGLLFYFEPMLDVSGMAAYYIEREKDCTVGCGILPGQNGETVGVIGGQLAINTSSKNVLNAWNFIKFILSEEIQSNGSYHSILNGVPARRESVRDCVAWGTGYYGKPEKAGLLPIERDEILGLYENMDRFVWRESSMVLDMTWEAVLPYLRDEKNCDDCLRELKSKLTFYFSE